jgi:hypothetical protein
MFATGNHTCRSYGFWPAWSDSALRMYMNWLSRTVGAGWLAAASATLASSTAAVSGAVGVALAPPECSQDRSPQLVVGGPGNKLLQTCRNLL